MSPSPRTGNSVWARCGHDVAGWRRPLPYGVCDVPKGHARVGSSIQPVHTQH